MQDPYRCLEITVLKKPRSEEARQLLNKVAKQVQPIMRKRQWTVKKVGKAQHNTQQLQLFWATNSKYPLRYCPAYCL
jgi:arsenate reductase-like glutaredoxin family protein